MGIDEFMAELESALNEIIAKCDVPGNIAIWSEADGWTVCDEYGDERKIIIESY